MVREDFSSNEVLEQRPQGSEEEPLETWGKSLPGRGKRKGKGPEEHGGLARAKPALIP